MTSEVGVGSTFAIELPAEVKAATVAKAAAEAPGQRDGARIPEGERPILVIDDDPHARELLLRTLEADGHLVVTAASGEEGLDIARRLKPSLITLDIMMPDMDGWATLRAIKSEPEIEHIPVVMVSIVSDKDMGVCARGCRVADQAGRSGAVATGRAAVCRPERGSTCPGCGG